MASVTRHYACQRAARGSPAAPVGTRHTLRPMLGKVVVIVLVVLVVLWLLTRLRDSGRGGR